MRSVNRRISVLLAGMAAIAACDKTPTGGSTNTEPITCHSGQEGGFPSSITFTVTVPECPIPIRTRYAPVSWGGRMDAPKSTFTTLFPGTDIVVLDKYSASLVSSTPSVPWWENPQNTTKLYLDFASWDGKPGTYLAPNSTSKFVDSVVVSQWNLAGVSGSGMRKAWRVMPGVITTISQTVLGVSTLNAGGSSTWRAKTDWDTSGYRFKWLLNGQPITGATNAQLTRAFNYSGSHTLKSIAIRADETADTVTRSISAVFSGEIYGPDDVATLPWCNLYYQHQYTTGGTAPITLLWEVSEGVTIKQNDGFAIYASMTEGLQWIQLKMTDAYGNVGYAFMYVSASENGQNCSP